MKTRVTFKGLDDRGHIIFRTIPIEHNFSVIPSEEFLGYNLPAQSVESQVIDYLDTIDKQHIMDEYGFSIILDYYITKRNKNKYQEFDDFIDYLSAITPIDRSLEAIIMESKDILFGKNKSHMQKAVEVFTMRGMAFKVINNTLQVVNKILSTPTRKAVKLKTIDNHGSN